MLKVAGGWESGFCVLAENTTAQSFSGGIWLIGGVFLGVGKIGYPVRLLLCFKSGGGRLRLCRSAMRRTRIFAKERDAAEGLRQKGILAQGCG